MKLNCYKSFEAQRNGPQVADILVALIIGGIADTLVCGGNTDA